MRALPLLVLVVPLLAGCAQPGPDGPLLVPSPKVVLLDADKNEVVAVDLPDLGDRQRELVGLGPVALALRPGSRHILVTNAGSNSVGVRNSTTLGALDSFVIHTELRVERNRPAFAASTPDGRELWASLPEANKIARFAFLSRDPLPPIALPFSPGPFTFTDRGDAWVVEHQGSRVAVLDANRTVVELLDVGTEFRDVDAREHLVFAIDRRDGLFVFWAENRTLRESAPLSGYQSLAMSGDGTALALANPDEGKILLFDGPRKVFKEITLGGRPGAVAFWDERGWLLIGTESGRLLVADANGAILKERRIGGTFADALVVP